MSHLTKRQRSGIEMEQLSWERFRGTCESCGTTTTQQRQKFVISHLNEKCKPTCERRLKEERRNR